MENTAAKLEALLHQASTKLDAISIELDLQLTKEMGMQSSLISVIRKLNDMTYELENMKQVASTLVEDQEVMKEKAVSLLPELTTKLHHLEGQTGSNNNNNYTSSNLINKFDNLNV